MFATNQNISERDNAFSQKQLASMQSGLKQDKLRTSLDDKTPLLRNLINSKMKGCSELPLP